MEKGLNPVIVGNDFLTNYLSFKLANSGFLPIILNQKENIEKDFKIILTDAFIEAFIGKEKLDSITIKKIQKFKIVFGKKELNVKLSKPVCVIDENKLSNIYQKMAEEKGAKYYFGNEIKKYVVADKVYGKTNEIKFSTDLLIINKNEAVESLNIMQAICEFNEERDFVTFFFDKDLTEIPYAWIIPLNNNKVCVGYFAEKIDEEKFNEFLNYFDIAPLKKYSFTVPIEKPSILVKNRVMYVGESGGFYNPITGNSIINSLKSSEIVLSAIKKAYSEEEFSSKFLRENYEIPVKEEILLNNLLQYKTRNILTIASNNDYESICDVLKSVLEKKNQKLFEIKNYEFMIQELIHTAMLNKKLKLRFLLKNLRI